MRAWDNEIDLDEILDIVQQRMLNTNTELVKFLLLWYISFCKKGNKIESAIKDLVADYNCPNIKFTQFCSVLDSISNMIKPIKKLKDIEGEDNTELVNSMVLSLENNFKYACSLYNREAFRLELGFFYGLLLKSKVISIETIDNIHESIILKSPGCYAVLFYHIMKMIDKNILLDNNKCPALSKEESENASRFNNKNNKTNNTKSATTKTKTKTTKEIKNNTNEVKLIDKLNSISNKEATVTIKGKYKINFVSVYKNVVEDDHTITAMSEKYNLAQQGLRARLRQFCLKYNLPAPRTVKSLDIVLESENDNIVAEEAEDKMFLLAQQKNAKDIQKLKNSKTCFPSDTTTVKPRKSNRPINKGKDNIDLSISEEQMNKIISQGEQWLTLNDGSPYYITEDLKIWRNKPTKEDLQLYSLN